MSGLTTGQVAKYCLVSPDTIQNWIQSEALPAQRTLGGQYRIRAEDLRSFMIEHRMSVSELDWDLMGEVPLRCWEYYARTPEGRTGTEGCEGCIVRRCEALRCYELRQHVDHRRAHGAEGCSACAYYRAHGLGERPL